LDVPIEIARRQEETQIPLKTAQDAMTFAAECMRIAFMQFLSAQGKALMGIGDLGEWKFYAAERFRGLLSCCSMAPARPIRRFRTRLRNESKLRWNVQEP
jgi:hypothetical protein